jgi:hypothetical protein
MRAVFFEYPRPVDDEYVRVFGDQAIGRFRW